MASASGGYGVKVEKARLVIEMLGKEIAFMTSNGLMARSITSSHQEISRKHQ